MATADVQEREQVLGQLADLVASQLADLLSAWRLRGLPLTDLPFAVLRIVEPLITLAADLAAFWYHEAAPELPYRAVTAPLPPQGQLLGSVRWAVSHLWDEDEDWDGALSKLTGSMTRAVLGGSRDTTVLNVASEPGARWARVAAPDACAFCRMLATRDEHQYSTLYKSAKSALTVVGKGRSHLSRNGREAGELYHDHCRCVAFEVRPGHSFQHPDHVVAWFDQYKAATEAVSEAGLPATAKNIVHAWDAQIRAESRGTGE